jgi:hypothetical protein
MSETTFVYHCHLKQNQTTKHPKMTGLHKMKSGLLIRPPEPEYLRVEMLGILTAITILKKANAASNCLT